MAYVTSTNLCYHDNMHVECSLVVDRFSRTSTVQIVPISKVQYRLPFISCRGKDHRDSSTWAGMDELLSVILGYMGPHCGMGCKCPPPPPPQ